MSRLTLAKHTVDWNRPVLAWIDALQGRLGRRLKSAPHLATGLRGEQEAFFYLKGRGYVVVARRWKTPKVPGDVDLIAWDAGTLCFVEVKTRTRRSVVPAEFSVDEHKQNTLKTLAAIYRKRLTVRGKTPIPIRFDVVSVYLAEPAGEDSGSKRSVVIDHFPAAFPLRR